MAPSLTKVNRASYLRKSLSEKHIKNKDADQELKRFMTAIDSDIARIEAMATELEEPDKASKLIDSKIDTSHIKKLISQLEAGMPKKPLYSIPKPSPNLPSENVSNLRNLFEGVDKIKPKYRKSVSARFQPIKKTI